MNERQVDIAIVGGGLIGATLMLALRGLGYSTLLIESKDFRDPRGTDFDARSLALSPASQRIFGTLGIWDLLREFVTPIEHIHVSDRHRFGVSRLQGNASNPLGYVVEMQALSEVLQQSLEKQQVLAPATLLALDESQQKLRVRVETAELSISVQLLVAADGTGSSVRAMCGLPVEVKEYQQQALVANVALNRPHHFKAFERFTGNGLLALLPMQGQRMSLVWAMPPEEAKQKMALTDAAFKADLQSVLGYRLGQFTRIGKRFSYPLKQALMRQQANWPVVFVGNAAHTLHPVAGQGFNLGLRDVATLAQCIARQGLSKGGLDQYVQLRQHDQHAIAHLTDGLVQLFTSRLPGMGLARSMGLIAVDNVPVLKRYLARYARGFGGVIPDLACGIALRDRESG